ncbi:MAG TPA: hypothetical protein VH040_17915 [Usitatibacter sp.]|jgi:hypothetical protein|nr:hypothetical protein [Usitatibacter sp.]
MTKILVAVAALAGFVAYCVQRGNAQRGVGGAQRADLTRWEGEGGNVPQVATPSPAPVPESSFPGNGSEARH